MQETDLKPAIELEGGEVGGFLDDDKVREGLADDDGREDEGHPSNTGYLPIGIDLENNIQIFEWPTPLVVSSRCVDLREDDPKHPPVQSEHASQGGIDSGKAGKAVEFNWLRDMLERLVSPYSEQNPGPLDVIIGDADADSGGE